MVFSRKNIGRKRNLRKTKNNKFIKNKKRNLKSRKSKKGGQEASQAPKNKWQNAASKMAMYSDAASAARIDEAMNSWRKTGVIKGSSKKNDPEEDVPEEDVPEEDVPEICKICKDYENKCPSEV